jgi:hypothetical protein
VQANRRARRPASSCTRRWTRFVTVSTGRDRRNRPLRSASPKRVVPASIFLRRGEGRLRRGHAAARNTPMKQARADENRGAGRVLPARSSGRLNASREVQPRDAHCRNRPNVLPAAAALPHVPQPPARRSGPRVQRAVRSPRGRLRAQGAGGDTN